MEIRTFLWRVRAKTVKAVKAVRGQGSRNGQGSESSNGSEGSNGSEHIRKKSNFYRSIGNIKSLPKQQKHRRTLKLAKNLVLSKESCWGSNRKLRETTESLGSNEKLREAMET